MTDVDIPGKLRAPRRSQGRERHGRCPARALTGTLPRAREARPERSAAAIVGIMGVEGDRRSGVQPTEGPGGQPPEGPGRQQTGAPRPAVLEAARFLAANAERRVLLGDVADHVAYSPWHLAHAFRDDLGLSPGRYLASWRFQRAKRLLVATDAKVVDVCHAVGCESLGSFTSRFSADVGVSPTAFRRLPDLLAATPPRPVSRPGSAAPASTVAGWVGVAPEALAALGGRASVYVGLFDRHVASGTPVSGALLPEPGPFSLGGVPAGWWWLLGAALPATADPAAQLLPTLAVVGATGPLFVGELPACHRADLYLGVAGPWTPPVVVALPPLATAPSARPLGGVAARRIR